MLNSFTAHPGKGRSNKATIAKKNLAISALYVNTCDYSSLS